MRAVKRETDSVRDRVQDAVIAALALAVGYSLIASVLRLLGGARVLDQLGVSLLEMILFYFGAAIVGGTLAGLLMPLGRRPLGGALVGFVVGLVVFAPLVTLFGGAVRNPYGALIIQSAKDVLAVAAICALCVGAPAGYLLSRDARRS
jgi:hypothetical protein